MRRKQLPFIIATLADLVGVGLFLLLMPLLVEPFNNTGFLNTLWMGLAFALFCVAVFYLQKLLPLDDSPRPTWLTRILANKPLLVALAVIMAFFTALATAYLVGFLDSVVNLNRGLLDEPAVTIYLLLPPASYFGLALIYVLVLSAPTGAIIEPANSRYALVAFLGLCGVNLMAAVLTIVASVLVDRFLPGESALWPGLLLYILLFLLFLPPRLIYLARVNRPVTLLTFLLFLAFLAAAI